MSQSDKALIRILMVTMIAASTVTYAGSSTPGNSNVVSNYRVERELRGSYEPRPSVAQNKKAANSTASKLLKASRAGESNSKFYAGGGVDQSPAR